MKIGVVGTGNVGSSVAGLLARAGHEIRFGSRGGPRLRPRGARVQRPDASGRDAARAWA